VAARRNCLGSRASRFPYLPPLTFLFLFFFFFWSSTRRRAFPLPVSCTYLAFFLSPSVAESLRELPPYQCPEVFSTDDFLFRFGFLSVFGYSPPYSPLFFSLRDAEDRAPEGFFSCLQELVPLRCAILTSSTYQIFYHLSSQHQLFFLSDPNQTREVFLASRLFQSPTSLRAPAGRLIRSFLFFNSPPHPPFDSAGPITSRRSSVSLACIEYLIRVCFSERSELKRKIETLVLPARHFHVEALFLGFPALHVP